jgi:tripartite-type tricarboxylate transporter receptor subunit TctC
VLAPAAARIRTRLAEVSPAIEVGSMRIRALIMAGVLAVIIPQTAFAQFYKGKTITMVINYPAGGPSDIEGRIVAQHLPAHIPGKPTIVIKNVGGAGGVIGANQLGEAAPNGENMGFFTLDTIGHIVGNPAIRVSYTDFVLIAGVANPLVVYIRKDTPPGIQVATDIMKANEFKALSLSVQNSNTVNQALMLDLLGVKNQAVPAFRGLKDVETAILQNQGQLANTSLPGWTSSVEPTMSDIVLPLWQLAPRGRDGSYPRSPALSNLPTFEEFYASVRGGNTPSGILYEALRTGADAQLAMFRTAVMPPKTPAEAVATMRSAFVELWQDREFVRDYSSIVKTPPILVTGEEGQAIFAALANIRPEIKAFIIDYCNHLVK